MELRNPPILEAWIEFHARPAEIGSAWPGGIDSFLEGIGEELPEREARWASRLVVKGWDPQSGPPSRVEGEQRMDRVRAFDQEKTRCVQAGPDIFVYNLKRAGNDYPGFESLLEQSTRHFEQYKKCFRPASVQGASLHYLDLIRIPFGPESKLNLDEYFRLGVRVPEDASWPLTNVSATMRIPLKSQTQHDDSLELTFQRVTGTGGDVEARFLVYWKWQAENTDTLDGALLSRRLRKLHELSESYFRMIATEKLWKLFEGEDVS